MLTNSNEIYSDQCESETDRINLVRQLDWNEKGNINNLEELLIKSKELNSSKCVRLIDQQIQNFPCEKDVLIVNLVLSCNIIGKTNEINWKVLPNNIQSLELGGNFLKSLEEIEKNANQLQSLGLTFNEISQIISLPKWSNLCLIDLSYNILNDLQKTVQSLQKLKQLRILFLHGNPLSLIIDYRVYLIDSLPKLSILDDLTITTEERFRSRTFSNCNEHREDNAQFTITFGTIENIPQPILSESEWPIRVDRYKMVIDWFEEEKAKEEIEIPFDKMSNFNRFYSNEIQSAYSDYKSIINFSPSHLDLTINNLISFRDFLFHGTTCRFIHQMTEYWQPGETLDGNDQKKKPNSSDKDKKIEVGTKKKKNEDLSKLIILKDPIEKVLAQFHVDLRPFLDGDYQVVSSFKSLIQQENIEENIQIKSTKKAQNKIESPQEKKRTSSSKSIKDKPKDKKPINENEDETIPLAQPFQCSITFQLHRYVAQGQII